MFLSEPQATGYDLNFSILGFPVRVHPAFFVMPLLLGGSVLRDTSMNAGITLLVLIAIFFVSILVHELGHAMAFRRYGLPARIVLYWMGGLAIPDSGGPWMPRSSVSLNAPQQIVVSLAGPIFGFLLAALLIGIVIALDGHVEVVWHGVLPIPLAKMPEHLTGKAGGMALYMFFRIGILVNIFLNLMNLVPVYPLDGGQVARQLFLINDPWNGLKYSMFLSIAVAAIIAFVSISGGDRFIGVFFAFMAWSNYMSMQQMGGGFGGRPW